MLLVFIKAVIIFVLVLIIVRLMGKRQIGEMQPFELVITIIIAEVACIPMNDPYIPFYSGIVPIITLATLEVVMSFFARKSLKVRRLFSGQSIIVIDKNGINYENLKKMNLNVNDLLESVRTNGNIDFAEIEYAIFETNGKICVVEKPVDPKAVKPALLPISLFIDGAWEEKNLILAGIDKKTIENVLRRKNIKTFKDVLYIDIRQDGTLYISPKREKCFTATVKISGGKSW